MITGRLAPASSVQRPRRATRPAARSRVGARGPRGRPAGASARRQRLHLVGEDRGARRRGASSACLHGRAPSARRGRSSRQHGLAPGGDRRRTRPRGRPPGRRPGPAPGRRPGPVSASTGARSTFASHSPVSRLVAPGPGDRQARGRAAGELAVGRGGERGGALVADADELQLAAPPRGGACASARPRLECPTMPKTCVTPQATSVSAMTSDDRAHVRRPRLHADVDAVVADLDGVASSTSSPKPGGGAGERAVVVAVPRAAQQPVLDRALAERAALVRAAVVERAVLPSTWVSATDLWPATTVAHPALGQLVHPGDAMPGQLGHAPCSPPGIRAVTQRP